MFKPNKNLKSRVYRICIGEQNKKGVDSQFLHYDDTIIWHQVHKELERCHKLIEALLRAYGHHELQHQHDNAVKELHKIIQDKKDD